MRSLRHSASHKQPVAATYDGQTRLLCPHVGGRKSGRMHVLCYQVGGGSNSAEPLAPEGHGVRRWLAVEKLTQVELCSNAWRTEPRSKRQTCLMKSISIPTFSLEAIHKRGNEATVAATSVPERCEWSRSSVGYDALGARGDPRGRKFGGGPAATNPR